MAPNDTKAKASKPGQLSTVTATEQLYAITPSTTIVTTSTTDEKREDHRRGSSVSTPTSIHQGNPFDTDIEAMVPSHSSDQLNLKQTCTSQKGNNPNCTVWPGQEHWRQKAKARKVKNRSCQCMAGYSQRTRIILKILIVFLIVGIAVGVGFGVSKPLGAGIWQPKEN